MPLTTGETILNGKYRILRLIGEGGMARVWLAEELTFGGRLVALKEPLQDLSSSAQADLEERFRREIQLSAALSQRQTAHVVRAFTAEPYEGRTLLVLDYMAGGSLGDRLAQHPEGLPVEDTLRITGELLTALQGFHDLPVTPVHRDIKPSNILFDDQGRANLADLGLAQLAGMSGRSQLQGGSHPATPLYAAPEQLRSPEPLLPAADLFALGCVVFEMLTGRRYKAVRPGTTVSDLRPEVPEWLAAALAKALEPDPWERWADAGEMVVALQMGMEARRGEAERIRRAEEEERRRREAEKREQARAQEAAQAKRAQEEQRQRLEAARKAQETSPGTTVVAETTPGSLTEAARARRGQATPTPGGLTRRRLLTGAAILGGLGGCGLLGQAAGLWSRGMPALTPMPPRPSDTPRPTRTNTPLPTATGTSRPSAITTPSATSIPASAPTSISGDLAPGDRVLVIGLAGAGLNLRAGAGTGHARVKTLPEGEELEIIGGPREADGITWWQVRDQAGTTGWVGAQFLVRSSSEEGLEIPTGNPFVLTLAPSVTLDLVRVPAGEFLMGSADDDEGAWDDEKPQHSLHLDEYLIGKYPVTVAQYRAFVRATGHSGNSDALKDPADHPVRRVSWNDAVAFCGWLSEVSGRLVRLPTEAQWEKAARGTDGRLYPWGDAWVPTRCNTSEGGVGDTTPVGRYSPAGDSPYGCADMAGNIYEWVADWYDEEYYQKAGSSANPTGPATGRDRVVRGGSWLYARRYARCASRNWPNPNSRHDHFGFRVVVALPISQRS